jgi:2',3'-cyclic-nucleotide 2'-phosphodiesterase (5'-nucleotidase family)
LFDSDKESGNRIQKKDIYIDGDKLDYEKKYSVAMKYFISLGKDGYDVFTDCPYLIDEEQGKKKKKKKKNRI